MIKPELILPAGNREKATYALVYGADAVYAGIPGLSLRSKYTSFDATTLGIAIEDAHTMGRRFYVACNLFAHEADLGRLKRFLDVMDEQRPDAIIVSDPGVIRLIRKRQSTVPLHLSTQANTTNSQAVQFWRDEGIGRIILARELQLQELEMICGACDGIEIEIFVHGAMCISYSGRCLLSNVLTGRDANRGACAGSCRWRYALVEESREGEYFEIEEDTRGSYILNSRDLCLLQHIPQLSHLPIHGYKIEGRTKNLLYVSLIARAYRHVIDDVFDRGLKSIDDTAMRLLALTDSHGFTGGFLFPETEPMQSYDSGALRSQQLLGYIMKHDKREMSIAVKNPLSLGDSAIVISPDVIATVRIEELTMNGEPVAHAYGAMGHEVIARIDKDLPVSAWQYGLLVKGGKGR